MPKSAIAAHSDRGTFGCTLVDERIVEHLPPTIVDIDLQQWQSGIGPNKLVEDGRLMKLQRAG